MLISGRCLLAELISYKVFGGEQETKVKSVIRLNLDYYKDNTLWVSFWTYRELLTTLESAQ